ncbi:hypothetical protein K523DRAFT_244126 [Schizophyllum commune Tattone D]|nr:hypothetical protein K523DRAFT_244126 [Schizophyllum commune Tattone D]
MGGCASKPVDLEAKARSDDIDKMIEEDGKRLKKECKILLLGSGESGKSTIVKQMKIIHQDGFSQDELIAFRPIIHRNVLDSAKAILVHMKKLSVECEDFKNRVRANRCRSGRAC